MCVLYASTVHFFFCILVGANGLSFVNVQVEILQVFGSTCGVIYLSVCAISISIASSCISPAVASLCLSCV